MRSPPSSLTVFFHHQHTTGDMLRRRPHTLSIAWRRRDEPRASCETLTAEKESTVALFRTAAISGFVLLLAACSTILYRPCTRDEWVVVQDSLYFGTAKPDGIISPEEWAAFLSAVVTPRFPQGLTVWQASGQWRTGNGTIVRETSNILVLVHPDDDASETSVREIIRVYKAQFQQEAILRLRSMTCTSF